MEKLTIDLFYTEVDGGRVYDTEEMIRQLYLKIAALEKFNNSNCKKWLVVDTWNGEMMDMCNGSNIEVFDDFRKAKHLAWKSAIQEAVEEDECVKDITDMDPSTSLTNNYIYEVNDWQGTYQVHKMNDDIYAVKILCNINEVELLTKEEYDNDPDNDGSDFVDDGQYFIKFVLIDSIHRNAKIKKIVDARINWTIEDYEEAYGDVWDEIPSSLRECQARMEEYIYNTYDDDLLDEILNDELNN